AHPRVAEKVVERADVDSDAQLVWLTSEQADVLRAELDGDPPAGSWAVRVVSWAGYATEVTLNVDGRPVRLRPGSSERLPRLADPLPAVMVTAALWSALDATEVGNRIPLRWAVVPVALFGLGTIPADRWYRR